MEITLSVNEQLAKAMTAGSQFKVEIERVIEITCEENDILKEYRNEYEQMSSDICDMLGKIGESMGLLLTQITLEKVKEVNPINNK